MFNDYSVLKREIEALKKEIQTLKDDQIKQNRDYKDAMYNLDSDNLPALQGIVKKVNLAITEGGKVTAQFIMDVVNGESNAKIKADRIELEGSNFVGMFLKDTDVDASFVMERVNDESAAKIKADRLDIEGKQLNIKVDAANITGTLTVKEADGDVLLSAGEDDSGESKVQIAGWNVDNNSLWTGDSFSAENSIFLCRGSIGSGISIAGSPKKTGWIIKAGKNFGVDKEGEAYLSKAHIRRGCVIGEDIEEGNGVQLGPVYEDENSLSRSEIDLLMNEDGISGGYTRGLKIGSTVVRGKNFADEHSDIKAMVGETVIDPFKSGTSMKTSTVEDIVLREKGFVGLERSNTAIGESDEHIKAIMRVGEHALWIDSKGNLCTTAKALLTEQ